MKDWLIIIGFILGGFFLILVASMILAPIFDLLEKVFLFALTFGLPLVYLYAFYDSAKKKDE